MDLFIREVKISLRRHEYENDNEISLSFSLCFCTQRDELLIASIFLSSTTITNRNPGRTHEMMMSADKKCRSRTRCRSVFLTSPLKVNQYKSFTFKDNMIA